MRKSFNGVITTSLRLCLLTRISVAVRWSNEIRQPQHFLITRTHYP